MCLRAKIVAIVLVATACSNPSGAVGPVPVLAPTGEIVTAPAAATECSDSANLALVRNELDGLAMLRRAAELAAKQDMTCGMPEQLQRQCRAVFFLNSTEPTLVWAEGGDWMASLEVWRFATKDGAASSPPDLVLMWGQLGRFTDDLAVAFAADDEVTIARRVVERADAVDDLAALENLCALG